MRDEELFAIKDRAAKVFLEIPHVNAVGIGGRRQAGQPTGEMVIKVFVTKKKAEEDVPPEELIPPEFEGVPTDVVVMGSIKLLAAVPGAVKPFLDDNDPVPGGIIVGGTTFGLELDLSVPGVRRFGTLGCIVIDRTNPTAVYGLTNHHIMTDKKGRISLSRRIEHGSVGPNFAPTHSIGLTAVGIDDSIVDAALIRLKPGVKWKAENKEIKAITGTHKVTPAEAATGTYPVCKRGPTTGLTGGVVESIESVCFADSSCKSNAIMIRPNANEGHPDDLPYFAHLGDSGSVVVNEANEVVALLFGAIIADSPTSINEDEGIGGATPIDAVLERFKKVEKLDLEVATATDPAPTETVPFPSGVGRMSGNDIRERADAGYYRPVTGGSRIGADPWGHYLNTQTLGCLVEVTGEADAAYVLTSYDSISLQGSAAATAGTEMGQPDNDSSISGCCANTIGEFAKGGADDTRDAALIKLEDGMKWLAEVLEVGFIKGIHTVTTAECASGTYQVRKRGAQSRLTGGVVTVVGGVHGTLPEGVNANAMLIEPNPNPDTVGNPNYFSHFGDAGAVVVNEDDEVIGLLYDEIEVPPGSDVFHGVATPIQKVLDGFQTLDSVTVTVAMASKVDDVHTAVSAALQAEESLAIRPAPVPRMPEATAFPRVEPLPSGMIARLQDDFAGSGGERLVVSLWKKHRVEIRRLIDHNRRVATAWHRSGGPVLIQGLFRALQTPSAVVPTAINGLPVSTCIDRLHTVFSKYGSKPLRADLDLLRPVLLEVGGLSYPEIVRVFESYTEATSAARSEIL